MIWQQLEMCHTHFITHHSQLSWSPEASWCLVSPLRWWCWRTSSTRLTPSTAVGGNSHWRHTAGHTLLLRCSSDAWYIHIGPCAWTWWSWAAELGSESERCRASETHWVPSWWWWWWRWWRWRGSLACWEVGAKESKHQLTLLESNIFTDYLSFLPSSHSTLCPKNDV